jgi:hypothetical protein
VGIGLFLGGSPREQETADNRDVALRGKLRERTGLPSLILMTTRPERFRVKALENYLAAQEAKNPEIREAYLELMRNWRDLAAEIEHFEHAWLDRDGI